MRPETEVKMRSFIDWHTGRTITDAEWAKHLNGFRRDEIKARTHIAVGKAIADGILTRQACEICGATPTHAHHDDYTKPLEVRWLCNSHHRLWHGSFNAKVEAGDPEPGPKPRKCCPTCKRPLP